MLFVLDPVFLSLLENLQIMIVLGDSCCCLILRMRVRVLPAPKGQSPVSELGLLLKAR